MEVLAALGIMALAGLLTYIALKIVCWISRKIFTAICSLFEKIGKVAGTIRKNMAKKKFLKKLEKAMREVGQEDADAIKEVFEDLNRNDADAFCVPVNERGEEDFSEIKIIRAENTTQDDIPDFSYVHTHKRIIREMV